MNGFTQAAALLRAIVADGDMPRIKEARKTLELLDLAIKAQQPQLNVWEGAMPESNGKSNFTAILRREGASLFDGIDHCIARSEYPGRVKYEADRVRYLIGELAERPDILDYDADKRSDYKPRDHEWFFSLYDLGKLVGNGLTQEQYEDIVQFLKAKP